MIVQTAAPGLMRIGPRVAAGLRIHGEKDAMTDRPNILFILTDQQSATMMGCAGNRHLHTPAMDSLAASGVLFERAYCTNPVCVPSRFSLMTGRMPGEIGMASNAAPPIAAIPDSIKRDGLGRLARKAGYEAAYGGKAHLPRMSAEEVGFDCICQDERELLTGACVEFIHRKRAAPFFLVASFINPHDICYMAIRDSLSNKSERRYIARGIVECGTLDAALKRPPGGDETTFCREYCPPLPPNFEPQADEPEAIRVLLERRPFRMRARREWGEDRWREHRWAYARLTEMVDARIAPVLEALNDSGQADRTLVIFTSDHGDMDAAHRMEHKSTLYEEVCRVPLIIRPPGNAAPGLVDSARLVSNGLDLLPTICDYAGVEPPQGLMGRSLRPLVESGAPAPWRDALPVESAIGRAIVTDRFKYAVYDLGTCQEQLIDLREDPGEMRNCASVPRHRHTLEKLRRMFQETFGSGQRNPADLLRAAAEA